MKKILTIGLSLFLIFALCGCTAADSEGEEGKEPEVVNKTALTIECDNGTVRISRLPESVEELELFDLKDEHQAGMALIVTLLKFADDFELAYEMLDYIMGPESPSDFDRSFIKNQLDQYPYVMRSYFAGASVENDYQLDENNLAIEFSENDYSRSEDGYLKLWIVSAGADSPRSFTLRQKASTGEWFLFSDTYKGLMAGIRMPASADAWS